MLFTLQESRTMIKQTVLKFQGALGLLGLGHKDDQEDGDSGNSTPTGF